MQKYQHLFDTSHLQSDLKKRSLRSGAVTLSSQATTFVIQMTSTMILARILTPEDYGMMAMVVAVTGFAGIFINLGLSTAVIQRPEINHEQVSTLFWVNTGVGALVMLIVAALSPVIAWFYQTPALKWVAVALSCNFLINGLAVQHQALLNRQMRFVAIAVIQVGAMIAGIAVAILAGIYGFGYWALVLNSLTISVVTVIGGWIASGWWPGLPRRNVGVGEMIRFGSDIVGFNVVNYFARNLDNVLIGRYHGSGQLGLYSKAYQLLMMPITNLRDPMNRVAMPALSRLQNAPEEYRNYYMKFVSILAFISMPMVAFMFVCSDQIILIVLGEQWTGVGEIFKILSLVAFIQPLSSSRGVVLLTTGKSRKYLILGVISSFLLCLSFVLGIPWGAKGVATAYAISVYLIIVPFLYLSFKGTSVTVGSFFSAIYKPCLSSLFMAGVCMLTLYHLDYDNTLVVILICFFSSFSSYLLANIVVSRGIKDLRQYIDYLKIIFRKK